MKKKFVSFQEMTDFYLSTLQKPMLGELEVCYNIVHSKDFSDREKAEILLLGGHQWRLSLHPIERDDAIGRLKDAALWNRTYKDFEEVYQTVCETIVSVKYVGMLACYDAAKRIAHCCGLQPERLVYLCCGARTGAKALLGNGQVSGYVMETTVFQKYFLGLSALHIENILCIMKGFFEDGQIKKDAERLFSDCICWRWTCSRELREKYEKTFLSIRLSVSPSV